MFVAGCDIFQRYLSVLLIESCTSHYHDIDVVIYDIKRQTTQTVGDTEVVYFQTDLEHMSQIQMDHLALP